MTGLIWRQKQDLPVFDLSASTSSSMPRKNFMNLVPLGMYSIIAQSDLLKANQDDADQTKPIRCHRYVRLSCSLYNIKFFQ